MYKDMNTDTSSMEHLLDRISQKPAFVFGDRVKFLKEPPETVAFSRLYSDPTNVFGTVGYIGGKVVCIDVESDRGNLVRFRVPLDTWYDYIELVSHATFVVDYDL